MASIDDDDLGHYLFGTFGPDTIAGNGGDDYILAFDGNDIADGGAGNDIVDGGFGADRLSGGDGSDHLIADGSDTLVDGGAGLDRATLVFDPPAPGVTLSIADPSVPATAGALTLVRVEILEFGGGDGDDHVTGGDQADSLDGRYGDDILHGGGGDDFLYGGVEFSDTQSTDDFGADALFGEAGDDEIYADAHDRIVDGGDGVDILHFDASQLPVGVTFDFADQTTAAGLTVNGTVIRGFEGLYFNGTAYDDDVTLGPTSTSNVLLGNDGNDRLNAGPGSAVLDGGAGADALYGGDGGDFIFGGLGNDTVYAGANDDEVSGGANNDRLLGEAGRDTLYGDEGNDMLDGGADNDFLFGGNGKDILIGGLGKDVLTGGAGADVFRFEALDSRPGGGARDVITDFQRGTDKIDLSALGLAFGDLTFKVVGSGLVIYGDVDKDGLDSSDFGLQLTGISALDAGDFIFA